MDGTHSKERAPSRRSYTSLELQAKAVSPGIFAPHKTNVTERKAKMSQANRDADGSIGAIMLEANFIFEWEDQIKAGIMSKERDRLRERSAGLVCGVRVSQRRQARRFRARFGLLNPIES
jgi:hypothetical protein